MSRAATIILIIASAFAWMAVCSVASHYLRGDAFGQRRNMPTRGSIALRWAGILGADLILLTFLIWAIISRAQQEG